MPMIATRTFSSCLPAPLPLPLVEAMVSPFRPRPSERVSTISSFVFRRRCAARCASFSLRSGGIRNSTSPLGRGPEPLRPVGTYGTANREARSPTATSLRLAPRTATSSASRRFSCAGILTRTLVRSRAIGREHSTSVLSGADHLAADAPDPLPDRPPRQRRQEDDRPRQAAPRSEDESGDEHDDPLGAA